VGIEEFSNLPLHLEDWTYETVEHLVQTHDFEPGIFDYKDVLNPTGTDEHYKENHRNSIRRTVCSMANTDGGFIIFGVKDRKNVQGTDTLEDRIPGIPLNGELLSEFGSKIAVLQPDVHCEPIPQAIPVPHRPGKGIFVVRIPQSQRRPHMVFFEGGRGGIYYKRGEHGAAVAMSHSEVREQMMYTEERMKKVTLLRLELAQYMRITAYVKSDTVWTLYRFDVSAFKVLLAEICGLLPANILSTMLDIPQEANIMNRRLEQVYGQQHNTYPSISEIHGYLNGFCDLCKKCEISLEHIFGPLGMG
jgi:hypothetical protein